MSIVQISGPVKSRVYTKTASSAFAAGQGLEFNSGKVDAAQAATLVLAGISQRTVASTDSDYATANDTLVNIPHDGAVYLVDVITGTGAATSVGNQYDANSTFTGIDLTGTSYKQFTVVGFVSATQLLCKINEAAVSIA